MWRSTRMCQRVLLALLVSLLASCAGQDQAPVSLTDLPSPPGAIVYEGEAESLIDTLLLAGSAAYGDEQMEADSQLYAIPAPEARAESLAFFNAALPPLGWTPRPNMAIGGSLGQAWQRGEQRLTIAVVEVETNPIVVVVLSSPR
jgi:hypothetical protein